MRPLTDHSIDHDDPACEQHGIDKEQKRERLKTAWEPVPTIAAARGRIIEGLTKTPVQGFCFRMRAGEARREDGEQYRKDAKAMERKARTAKRTRIRDGKERKDTIKYKHGAQSLLATVPPWGWGTLKRIKDSERDFLMLRLAEVCSKKIEEISGRKTFGGGIHFDANAKDSFFPHIHCHVPKVSEDGTPHPKEKFICCDDWTANTLRVEANFPGLLSPKKVKRAKDNLAKKDPLKTGRKVIDTEVQEAMDKALEHWIESRGGLWAQYQKDKATYAVWKKKEEKLEPARRVVKANLSYFAQSGVWLPSYRSMTLAMWRMIPRDHRPAITLAIRASQHVRKGLRVASGIINMIDGPSVPVLPLPLR